MCVGCGMMTAGLTMEFTEIIWKATVKLAFPSKQDYMVFMGNYSTVVSPGAHSKTMGVRNGEGRVRDGRQDHTRQIQERPAHTSSVLPQRATFCGGGGGRREPILSFK